MRQAYSVCFIVTILIIYTSYDGVDKKHAKLTSSTKAGKNHVPMFAPCATRRVLLREF